MDDEPTSETPFVRPLGPLAAAGWSAAFLLVFVFAASILSGLKPGAERDGVNAALLYVASVLVVLLALVRVHAPDAELRDVVAARPVGFVSALLAAVMGACAALPLGALESLVARRFPDPEGAAEYEQVLSGFGLRERVAGYLALVFVAPIADELFFRGAIASGVARDRGKATAAFVSAAAFALVSAAANLHYFVLYAAMGLVFVHARLATGSVLAALGAHLAYRGTELWLALKSYGTIDPLAAATSTATPVAPGWKLVAGASAAAVVCAVLLARLGHGEPRSAVEEPAREGDEP